MHTPEKPEEDKRNTESEQAQAATPLYEFPADDHFHNPYAYASFQAESEAKPETPGTRVLPLAEDAPPLEEAVRRGLIYPPPPSFYQNMQQKQIEVERTDAPPLPPPYFGGAIPSGQPYSVGVQPPPFAPPQPVKKSRRWIWIVVSSLSVVLLASCGLCGWATYSIFSSTYQQVSGSLTVVNDYYAAIQTQNYHAAYADLAPQDSISGLTETQFTQQAQSRDSQNGRVLSYTPGQPTYSTNTNTGPDLSRFTITVTVQRAKLNYVVLLTIQKVGNTWKITDFDRI